MALFTQQEYDERLGQAREALAAHGLDGAVCTAPETLFYLAGYEGYTYWADQALVLPVADDEAPTLLVRDTDVATAIETSVVRDIRTYHFGRDEPPTIVADLVTEKGLAGKAVGIEKQAYALPAASYERLAAALGKARLDDCSRLLSRLRVRKSDAELACVRAAARMAAAGMRAGLESIRPGRTEIEVAAAIESALRREGSEYSAMPTILGSGPRSAASHPTPTHRTIERGDPVLFYFAGVRHRYHVTTYRTAVAGKASSTFRRFYEAAEEGLDVLESNIEIGAPVARAARAAAEALRRTGFASYHVARWGYGVGISFPPVWLEAFDVIEESSDTFEPRTLMCLHINFSVPEHRFGIMVGRDYLLTDTGVEALDEIGTQLVEL